LEIAFVKHAIIDQLCTSYSMRDYLTFSLPTVPDANEVKPFQLTVKVDKGL